MGGSDGIDQNDGTFLMYIAQVLIYLEQNRYEVFWADDKHKKLVPKYQFSPLKVNGGYKSSILFMYHLIEDRILIKQSMGGLVPNNYSREVIASVEWISMEFLLL